MEGQRRPVRKQAQFCVVTGEFSDPRCLMNTLMCMALTGNKKYLTCLFADLHNFIMTI